MDYKLLKKELFKIYNEFPQEYAKELSKKCTEALKNKKCGITNEICCTVAHAYPIEKEFINNYIKEKKLNLPLIISKKDPATGAYHLPNTENQGAENWYLDKQNTKCLYFKNNSCLIYKNRPINCRMTGMISMQDCPLISDKTKMLSMNEMLEIIIKLRKLNNKVLPYDIML